MYEWLDRHGYSPFEGTAAADTTEVVQPADTDKHIHTPCQVGGWVVELASQVAAVITEMTNTNCTIKASAPLPHSSSSRHPVTYVCGDIENVFCLAL